MNYYGYNPYNGYPVPSYGNGFNALQNLNNGLPQSTIQQMNNQMQNATNLFSMNNQSVAQNTDSNFQYVDSKDVVKAINARLDGQPTYYPKTDGSEIYCKKLNLKTGEGVTSTYKLIEDSTTSYPQQIYDDSKISAMIAQLSNDINEIKDLVLENLTSPTKVGESHELATNVK